MNRPTLFRPVTLAAILVGAVLLLIDPASASARVVRPVPDFALEGSGGRLLSLKSLRGQPVVIVAAESASARSFRRQASYLEDLYRRFAGRKVVFVAALADPSRPIRSNIPFVLARDGSGVAASIGLAPKFGVAIVGGDGNLDFVSGRVISADRAKEIMDNNFAVQSAQRK